MWGLVMKRIRVDFLIVGAGLAGSVAGFLLKKAGADVLALELLDAKTKEKLCGGIMNKRALTQVAEVFGEGCMDTLRPMHIEKVWDRYAGLEILIESDVYYALPRKRLDDYCLERYLQAGGMLQDRASALPYVPIFAPGKRSKLNLAASLEQTEPCRQYAACLPEETSGLGLRWKEWFR